MAIDAADSRTTRVIQQNEFAAELVLIWGDSLAEDAKPGIAIALLHIAEHLIIGAVLFDDINDVLENRRLAGSFRHRLGRDALPRGQQRSFHRRVPIIRE